MGGDRVISADAIEQYYDGRRDKFVGDYEEKNPRVAQQKIFVAAVIPCVAERVLVIGCGTGETTYFIASRIAKAANILAVDISSQALDVARRLFPHRLIEYRQVNVLRESIEGTWDVILLPDVYEHISRQKREKLHCELKRLLAPHGRILLTVPSPGHQKMLRDKGEGLQIIDEDVTLEDLMELADDVGGVVTYFNMISVWRTHDYVHAIIERGAERVRKLERNDRLPVHGWPRWSVIEKSANRVSRLLRFPGIRRRFRSARVRRRLAQSSGFK